MEYNKEQLQELLNQCSTKADFCRALNKKPTGGNYRTIDKIIKDYNLDNSSLKKEPWNKGKHYKYKKYTLEEILIEDSPIKGTYHLKERLINNGLKEYKCEICGYTESVELHHINGNPFDNRLENLQILCPNCHSKTENFRYKNTSNYKGRIHSKPEDLIISEEEYNKLHKKPAKEKKPQLIKICPVCGKEFHPKNSSQKYCSMECYNDENKGKRPDFIQLINDFKELKSFVQVGNKYGVSDNAVRKWCKLYSIPIHAKEMKEYINNF